jgi:hypothetical protein
MSLSFKTQLFWRYKDASFTEEQSVQRNWTVGPNGGPYCLRLPQFEAAPSQLRLDLTDRPAILTLSSVTLLNDRAERIWSLDLQETHDFAIVGCQSRHCHPVRALWSLCGKLIRQSCFRSTAAFWLKSPPAQHSRFK